jgi:transcription elongation factor GreA
LEHLITVRRPEVAERIQQAKEYANTMENAEYDDAKNEQAFVEGRIQTVEKMLQNAVLIKDDGVNRDTVRLGCRVAVRNQEGEQEEYAIVGSAEANPRAGKISNESPVGKAIIGKKKGAVVEVEAPCGPHQVRNPGRTVGNRARPFWPGLCLS